MDKDQRSCNAVNQTILQSYRDAYAKGIRKLDMFSGIELNLGSLIKSLENYSCPFCEIVESM